MMSSEEQKNLIEKFTEEFDVPNDKWRQGDSYHHFRREFMFQAVTIMEQVVDNDQFKEKHPAAHKTLTESFSKAYDPKKKTFLGSQVRENFSYAFTNNAPEIIASFPSLQKPSKHQM